MSKFLWVCVIISSIWGGLSSFFGVTFAKSAPQEAAAAAVGMAFAVIPYCVARASSELGGGKKVVVKEEKKSDT